MKSEVSLVPVRLGHDTASFLFSVFVVIVSAFAGYGLAFLFLTSGGSLVLGVANPYAGCSLFADYVLRCAELCRTVLLETAAVWVSTYVDFEKPLLAVIFAVRGSSLGAGICAVTLAADFAELLFLPLACATVTAVFLVLTRYLRRENGRVPLSQSVVYALLAGGIASALTIGSTLFFT